MKEFCTTYILQIIGITFSIILFPSCASFDSARPTVVNSDKSTIHKINGRYLIYPSKVDTSHLNYVDNLDDNLIQELDRKPFKSRYDSLYYD
jgi:hypothetical protein